MKTQILIELIILIGTIFGGFFAMIRYFLKHLATKNDHNERISIEFAKVITNHLHDDLIQKEKLTASHAKMEKVLDKVLDKLK